MRRGARRKHCYAGSYNPGMTSTIPPRRVPKTKIEYAVQGNYGRWEDVTYEDTRKEARQRLKEYNENEPQAHRIIKRKVPR